MNNNNNNNSNNNNSNKNNKNKTILLVEDEHIIAMVEMQLLKKEGYHVTHVSNGEDAILFFQNKKEPVDLILMDINLGKGIDGTQAAAIILRDHDIPILFLSSHTEPEIVEKTEKITSYGYVVKNSGETVLFASIKMAFKLFQAKQTVQKHQQQLEETIHQLEVSNHELILSEKKYRALVELSPYLIDIHQDDIIRISRKQSEEKLRQQYDLLWATMDAIPNPVFYKNTLGQYTGCNRAFEEYMGLKKEEIIGKTVYDLAPPELAAKYNEKDQELLNTPSKQYYEWQIQRKNGAVRDVIFDKASLLDAQKQIQGIIGVITDITELKKGEWRNQLVNTILERLNNSQDVHETIHDILHIIKKNTAIEAVGIRLEVGDDFPYYETNGFPATFVQAERSLCSRDHAGEILHDATGKPLLECMCGTILTGRTNANLSFFTPGGSFWSNATTTLLAFSTASDSSVHLRNRCVNEGYESVALIPLRADQEIIGLLQFNDHRPNQFTLEMIQFFEGIGASIGIAFSRIRAEEKIKSLLAEKETLLHEVHHRIKNNMNTIFSLLRLQSNSQDNPVTAKVLQDAASRVRSMMILYEKLYHADNMNEISLQDFLPPLIKEISAIFPNSKAVQITTEIEDIVLAPKVLSPLGIILNELVTNAMKYAFNNNSEGMIRVTATKKDNRVTIGFADNGAGMPTGITIENATGFGLKLIDMLIKQLNGAITLQHHNGTTFIFEFPV